MSECMWIHYARPRPHWYGLDAATQTAHEKTWAAAADTSLAAGGSRLGRYHIRGQQDFETVEIWISERGGCIRALARVDGCGLWRTQRVREQHRPFDRGFALMTTPLLEAR